MAIDNENLEMIELLIASRVEMKDALLHAINEEFVEAVELLLDQESLIHIPGTLHVSVVESLIQWSDYHYFTAFNTYYISLL